jgi:hypothetical protein
LLKKQNDEKEEEKTVVKNRENRIKDALKNFFVEAKKFISPLETILKMNNSEKKDNFLCEAVIIGCLLLNKDFSFSSYEKLLVPIYKKALGEESLESNDIKRIGVMV